MTGELKKRQYGPWMMKAFRFLASRGGCVVARSISSRTPTSGAWSSNCPVDYRRLVEDLVAKPLRTTMRLLCNWRRFPKRFAATATIRNGMSKPRRRRDEAEGGL